jgi:DNA adenine methylase
MSEQLEIFESENCSKKEKVVNVSSIPKRSPFRYPGGKTWLVPIVRKWLKQESNVETLIEPFAGGGIVSLTAAFENLSEKVIMVELDEEISAVWEVILNGNNDWLANKIFTFDLTQKNIDAELLNSNKELKDIAFCTILKNRISHGGIITKGSGQIKNGENGKGLSSRWYAKTLKDRISAIKYVNKKIDFYCANAFDIIEEYMNNEKTYFFIDPPYTIAGKRLYTHFEIDHEKLFYQVSKIKGKFMLTYDDTNEIREYINKYNLSFRIIPMKTTHHLLKNEIIISDNFRWWPIITGANRVDGPAR